MSKKKVTKTTIEERRKQLEKEQDEQNELEAREYEEELDRKRRKRDEKLKRANQEMRDSEVVNQRKSVAVVIDEEEYDVEDAHESDETV